MIHLVEPFEWERTLKIGDLVGLQGGPFCPRNPNEYKYPDSVVYFTRHGFTFPAIILSERSYVAPGFFNAGWHTRYVLLPRGPFWIATDALVPLP